MVLEETERGATRLHLLASSVVVCMMSATSLDVCANLQMSKQVARTTQDVKGAARYQALPLLLYTYVVHMEDF